MNLNHKPTAIELAHLIADADPQGTYVLWVGLKGDVFLTDVADHKGPVEFCLRYKRHMQFRFATFFPCYVRGRFDLGPEAACDSAWIGILFRTLINTWQMELRALLPNHPMARQPLLASRVSHPRAIGYQAR